MIDEVAAKTLISTSIKVHCTFMDCKIYDSFLFHMYFYAIKNINKKTGCCYRISGFWNWQICHNITFTYLRRTFFNFLRFFIFTSFWRIIFFSSKSILLRLKNILNDHITFIKISLKHVNCYNSIKYAFKA